MSDVEPPLGVKTGSSPPWVCPTTRPPTSTITAMASRTSCLGRAKKPFMSVRGPSVLERFRPRAAARAGAGSLLAGSDSTVSFGAIMTTDNTAFTIHRLTGATN